MVKKVTKCRICSSKQLIPFLPLGNIPLPNGFLRPMDLKNDEKTYPLNVGICVDCSLVQLMEIVDPEIMFRNYVYIPSASQTRMRNFANIAEDSLRRFGLTLNDLVVDIGSNDGSLLSFFKVKGYNVLGIDPATNLSKIAELKGIETINDYISVDLAKKIRRKKGGARIVTATNVVAHINNLPGLLKAVSKLLDTRGVFICEFPYLLDLIEKNQFDTIYHEHLSYFSIKPLLKLIDSSSLKLIDIMRTPIDGGSLRTFLSPKNSSRSVKKSVRKLLFEEEKKGLYEIDEFKKFAVRVKELSNNLNQTLKNLKKKGKTIAGYGAAAKGNILLNYCKINSNMIDFIVDSTPYKQGLYTPGNHIPILPESEILSRKPDYTLILAWNFADEIIDKESAYRKSGGKFIIPVPTVSILK